MKIALITDTHWGARNDSVIFADYFSKFYDNVFFPYIDDHNIKTCIHLGDVVDRRKYINFKTANDLRENFVERLWEMNVDTHMIVGNHDIYYKNTNQVNSLTELFSTSDHILEPWIYASPREQEFDGTKILMMPWINSDNYTECMDAINNSSAQIMMGHLEINGFEMHRGQICDVGFGADMFSKFDLVFSGHFHHKSTQGGITYLGNPYEITWSDFGDARGFHVFDTDTRELHRVINPYKMFSKIYYDDINENYEKHDVEQYKDQYVKLIVVNKKDLYGFDKFTDRLLQADCHEVKIIEDFSDLDANTVSDDIVENTEDTMTLLGKYVDELNVNLDKDRLKNMMRSLYTEAQDLEL